MRNEGLQAMWRVFVIHLDADHKLLSALLDFIGTALQSGRHAENTPL